MRTLSFILVSMFLVPCYGGSQTLSYLTHHKNHNKLSKYYTFMQAVQVEKQHANTHIPMYIALNEDEYETFISHLCTLKNHNTQHMNPKFEALRLAFGDQLIGYINFCKGCSKKDYMKKFRFSRRELIVQILLPVKEVSTIASLLDIQSYNVNNLYEAIMYSDTQTLSSIINKNQWSQRIKLHRDAVTEDIKSTIIVNTFPTIPDNAHELKQLINKKKYVHKKYN